MISSCNGRKEVKPKYCFSSGSNGLEWSGTTLLYRDHDEFQTGKSLA